MIKEIVTREDYHFALRHLEALMDMDPELGSVIGEELDKQANQIEAYEIKQGWDFKCHHHS